jgi:hypothetical protein
VAVVLLSLLLVLMICADLLPTQAEFRQGLVAPLP